MKQLIDWSSSATGAGLFSDNLVLSVVSGNILIEVTAPPSLSPGLGA